MSDLPSDPAVAFGWLAAKSGVDILDMVDVAMFAHELGTIAAAERDEVIAALARDRDAARAEVAYWRGLLRKEASVHEATKAERDEWQRIATDASDTIDRQAEVLDDVTAERDALQALVNDLVQFIGSDREWMTTSLRDRLDAAAKVSDLSDAAPVPPAPPGSASTPPPA